MATGWSRASAPSVPVIGTLKDVKVPAVERFWLRHSPPPHRRLRAPSRIRERWLSMQPFEPLTSKVMSLPLDNVNTDQIIPARFLKRTNTDGWGADLFADWKRDPRFVLNNPR